MSNSPIVVGVLALQGSFEEHIALLEMVPGVTTREVRVVEELEGLDGIVLPGGESTAHAIIDGACGAVGGIFTALKAWVVAGKPAWGTCAGLILLSDRVSGRKKGGQSLVGGLDIEVQRNFFGSQRRSFELMLSPPPSTAGAAAAAGASVQPPPAKRAKSGGAAAAPKIAAADAPYNGIFIRAPAIMSVGEGATLLCSVEVVATDVEGAAGTSVGAAVRQGNLLGTTFHPELTKDPRWHAFFCAMVRE